MEPMTISTPKQYIESILVMYSENGKMKIYKLCKSPKTTRYAMEIEIENIIVS